MFDISFGEMLLVAVIGLLVLGPKEWPVAIRYLRGILRSVKQTSQAIRQQIDEVLEMDELQASVKTMVQGDDGTFYEAFDLSDMIHSKTVLAPQGEGAPSQVQPSICKTSSDFPSPQQQSPYVQDAANPS